MRRRRRPSWCAQQPTWPRTTTADLVIESIVEHLLTKQEFFRTLDDLCPPHVILATNTSGLRITEIAALMQHPERAVTTHFWNPGHLMPLVEVIQGERTSEETVQRAYRFLLRCGKRPVIGRKDLPGQICNRLQQALIREAIYMVQEGIASADDVEEALKAGAGLRWPVYGPFEHADVVGTKLSLAVQAAVLPSLCNLTEPAPLLQEMLDAGRLGIRSGQGFHDWTAHRRGRVAAQTRSLAGGTHEGRASPKLRIRQGITSALSFPRRRESGAARWPPALVGVAVAGSRTSPVSYQQPVPTDVRLDVGAQAGGVELPPGWILYQFMPLIVWRSNALNQPLDAKLPITCPFGAL